MFAHLRLARMSALLWIALGLATAAPVDAQEPIHYHLAFPAPAHHWAQIDVTFTGLAPAPLEARMSRASPGRYAEHEFAKNVYDVHAFDGRGNPLTPTRPDPAEWAIAGHDGTVRLTYKIYGDFVDGTYLAIDTTHAHLNMPATLMWARGLDDRAVRVTFDLPPHLRWTVATQLFPTEDPATFTAPNLQYLMDSPTELSAQAMRTFTVTNPDGRAQTIRTAVHHDATDADVDHYAAGVERIVREEMAIFGELPPFEPGSYTFLADYVPWGGGDGMEHRNSTVVADPVSIKGNATGVLETVAHEFFHCWNVERIRPRSLEPFDFEHANISGELWLAEGFTQYYGDLVLHRAGFVPLAHAVDTMGDYVDAVLNDPGRAVHSAIEMSELAPFTDAATAIDRTNLSNTFISYYTYGAAIALALDLSLRDRSDGRISLDDYMRAMWALHGRPGGPQPGLVGKPYTLQDAQDRLAEVSGDPAFAADFFAKYIKGHEVADYSRLLARAGLALTRRHPGRAWLGSPKVDQAGLVTGLIGPNTPAIAAGFDQDDRIMSIDGKTYGGAVTFESIVTAHSPGDRIEVRYRHPDGTAASGTIVLSEDPAIKIEPIEASGGRLTPAQQAFRNAWLGSRRR